MNEELYKEAVELVLTQRDCRVSFLQRKLSIGYALSAHLLDRMEEEGIVSAGGIEPRKILKSPLS